MGRSVNKNTPLVRLKGAVRPADKNYEQWLHARKKNLPDQDQESHHEGESSHGRDGKKGLDTVGDQNKEQKRAEPKRVKTRKDF